MKAHRPPVSVALLTCNSTRWLQPQLQSVLDQLEPTDELVVVDDASTDETVAMISASGDGRIRLLVNERNRGVRAGIERALMACRGDFIFLCDHDDIWLPGKRNTLVEALRAGAVLALSDTSVIDGDGRQTEASFMARRGGFRGSLPATLWKNRYLGCAMAFRRELLADILPIPDTVPMHDMWIGALATLRGPVAYIDRPLMQYRRHGGNVSPERRATLPQMLAWRAQLLSLIIARRLRGPRALTEHVD